MQKDLLAHGAETPSPHTFIFLQTVFSKEKINVRGLPVAGRVAEAVRRLGPDAPGHILRLPAGRRGDTPAIADALL